MKEIHLSKPLVLWSVLKMTNEGGSSRLILDAAG